jgi:hypothetical protein
MTAAIAINIVLGLLVIAVIVGMTLWAIFTHHHDRIAVVGDRRNVADRRTRAARPKADRRRGERRYGEPVPA